MYLDCKTIVFSVSVFSTNSLFEFGKTVQIFFLGKKKKMYMLLDVSVCM